MTVSGNSVYRSIQTKIGEIENEHEQYSRELGGYEQQIETLVGKREDCFAKLAAFYLPDLDAQSVQSTVKDLQTQVQQIFNEKQRARQELDTRLHDSRQSKENLVGNLESVTQQLETKVKNRDTLQKEVAQELDADTQYNALHSQAQIAQQRLDQNKRRHEAFKEEASGKLPAYEQGSLFMYLVRRKFGTAHYVESGLIAKLDGWVAGEINYTTSKKNYDFLKSMPDAIQEQITLQQEALDPLVQQIEQQERAVADKHGLTTVIADGKQLYDQRKKTIELLETQDAAFKEYTQQRAKLDNTKDEYHHTALDKLKSYLKSDTIAQLKQRARETQSLEDDGLVTKIEEMDQTIKELKASAKQAQQQQSDVASKLEGLRQVSRKYTHKNYESSRSQFSSGFDINPFLLGYITGQYTSDQINSHIESQHKWKPKETYTPSYSSYTPSWSSGSSSSSHHSSHSSSSDSSWGGGGSFDSGGGFDSGGSFSSGDGF